MTTKRERMYQRIERHGRNLLALFPEATEQDPVKLCKELRGLEESLHRIAEYYCSQSDYNIDQYQQVPLKKVAALLGTDRVWFNRNPCGYALKVDLVDGERLHTDMGGHGIIAPDWAERLINYKGRARQ